MCNRGSRGPDGVTEEQTTSPFNLEVDRTQIATNIQDATSRRLIEGLGVQLDLAPVFVDDQQLHDPRVLEKVAILVADERAACRYFNQAEPELQRVSQLTMQSLRFTSSPPSRVPFGPSILLAPSSRQAQRLEHQCRKKPASTFFRPSTPPRKTTARAWPLAQPGDRHAPPWQPHLPQQSGSRTPGKHLRPVPPLWGHKPGREQQPGRYTAGTTVRARNPS